MANTILTPSVIARAALATLYNNTVMAGLVYRDYDPDFNGKVGDTITVRKPATFTANVFDRASGITIQNATETGVPVSLNTLLDVSFAVTTEDLELKITDFAEQFLAPAMEAINQKVDQMLLALRSDITQSVAHTGGASGDLPVPKDMIDVRTILSNKAVPNTERYFALSPATAGNFLKDPLFVQANERGDTDGLREASIGRKFGFDTYETQNITDNHSVGFHRTAFALVTRTLGAPKGAAAYATETYKGMGIRVVYDYDITHKQDVVSIDTLVGVKTMDANRACLLVPEA